MREKISINEFRESLDRCLSGLKPDPQLAERIMATEDKEIPRLKKSVVLIAFIVFILCALGTGALAAMLNTWGIIDFAGMQNNNYVPPRYEDSIVHEDLTFDTEHVSCTILESYYDGKILRITAHIIPKESVLLIGGNASPADPVEDPFSNPEGKDISIAQYAWAHHDGQMADISLQAGKNDTHSYLPHDDGSISLYMECIFDEELAERHVEVELVYMPIRITAEMSAVYDSSAREITSIPMTFYAETTKTYTCDEILDFPSVGVKITNVTMTATPLEIRYALDFVITDMNAYTAQQGGLWFEFIDPSSTETTFAAQRVADGLTSSGSIGRPDGLHTPPDEVGNLYRQMGSIGLDAIGNQYTIRAYNALSKTRYETQTFHVKEK